VRRVPAESLLLGTVLLWSFNFTAARYGIEHGFSPLVYATLRWTIAGVALALVARARGLSLRLTRRELGLLAGAAALGVFLNQITFASALKLAPASTVALVFGTMPIFVALTAMVSGTERLRARYWVATAVSLAGVALVSLGAGGQISGSLGGILLTLATAITFGAYSVMVVPVMQRHSPLVITALTALIGAVMLALVSIPSLGGEHWGRVGGLSWTALAYSALASVVVGNVLWFTALDRIGPSRASLYANLQPFVGAIFALLVLSEHLGPLELAGGLVIAVSIAIGRRAQVAAPPAE
jgi:drug/metabolite transporter (DMT)-like permease